MQKIQSCSFAIFGYGKVSKRSGTTALLDYFFCNRDWTPGNCFDGFVGIVYFSVGIEFKLLLFQALRT